MYIENCYQLRILGSIFRTAKNIFCNYRKIEVTLIETERSCCSVFMAKKEKWVERNQGNKLGTRLFIWIISTLGVFPAYFVLYFAALQYTILDRKTKIILREFRGCLGLRHNLYDLYWHFYSFGMSLIDRYAFLISQKAFFKSTTHNEDLIEKEVKNGKGVILLGAHFGNWELAGNLLQGRLETMVNFLMFDSETEEMKEVVRKATENRKVGIIFVGKNHADTSIALINALRRGEIVCLNGDRVLDGQRSEDVMFFNKIARFPAGPFIVAAATGAPIIPIFAMKTGPLHYTFKAFDPIRLDSIPRDERQAKIRLAVEKYALLLEDMVRKHPLQWFNLYHFWG